MEDVEAMFVDLLSPVLVPAVVAAVVTLAFEVIFKPSIEVRKDRRLDRDRKRRAAVDAWRQLASRIEVVAGVRGKFKEPLATELGPLAADVAEARMHAVGIPWSEPEGAETLLTAALAYAQGAAIGIPPKLDDAVTFADVSAFVEPVKPDLTDASRYLRLVADYVDLPWWALFRRGKIRRSIRQEASGNEL